MIRPTAPVGTADLASLAGFDKGECSSYLSGARPAQIHMTGIFLDFAGGAASAKNATGRQACKDNLCSA
jgi:hypothetical protein